MADFNNTRISERKYYNIEPINLTADGTKDGLVTIPNTYSFKVNQKITLYSDAFQPRNYKIKQVLSETEIRVGDFETPRSEDADITDFLVVDNAMITLPEQNRPSIDQHYYSGMVFEEEPTVATRSHNVDWLGRSYSEENPIPVKPDTLTPGVDYDEIDITYPTTTQELFTYTLSAVSIRIVTVDYTDACKEDILKVTYNEL